MTLIGSVIVPPSTSSEENRAILEIIQAASTTLGIAVPAKVYGSTSRNDVELGQVAIEAARRIRDAYDWTVLSALQQEAGNDATEDFSLPSEFLRMRQGTAVWSSLNGTPLRRVQSEDDFLRLKLESYAGTHAWVVHQGYLRITPAPSALDTVEYYYVSRSFAETAAGVNRSIFTADSDFFRLDDRVLELGIIAHFKSVKGMENEDETMAYERALARSISDDRRFEAMAR